MQNYEGPFKEDGQSGKNDHDEDKTHYLGNREGKGADGQRGLGNITGQGFGLPHENELKDAVHGNEKGKGHHKARKHRLTNKGAKGKTA